MKVNYLILYEAKKLQFTGVNKFLSLIALLDNVNIIENEIAYKKSSYTFKLLEKTIEEEPQKKFVLYDLIIEGKENEKDVENLSLLLREIRVFISNQGGTLTPVLDEISSYYAEKAYPIINHIENLMRQLFTKFTLLKFGISWIDKIPKGTGPDKKQSNNGHNPLYDLDFIHLNELFFKEFAIEEANSNFLKELHTETFDKTRLELYIPQSNWTRYFSPLFECESEYFETRWEKLYKLRNKVAHNRTFSKDDLDDVKKITSDIGAKLNKAIDNIDSIEVTELVLPTKVKKALEGELLPNEPKEISQQTKSDSGVGGLVALGLIGAFLMR